MTATPLTRRERRTYFGFFVLVPMLGTVLGVNGAAVFQILAIENLGLNSQQIGLAVGLGAVSIPFQILAAKIPLSAAHRNLRVFILLMAAMCLVMAWLLIGSGLSVAAVVATVIAIAILAELAVSVLYATSFQPLLSTTVDPTSRQLLNGQGRAVSGVVALALVALVGSIGRDGRVAVVIGLAVLGGLLVPVVSQFRRPDVLSTAEVEAVAEGPTPWTPQLIWLIVAIGASVIPAWPFFVTYAADVYWPSANLGIVGAAITVGALAASALWRPTTVALLSRARGGAVVLLGCALALVPVGRALSGWTRGATTLVIIVLATAAGTVVRLALLEMVHSRATASSSVSILTMLDVAASTSMQVGFLVAGYLIGASVEGQGASGWFVDPFQLSLIAGGVLLVAALTQVTSTAIDRAAGDEVAG